MKKNSLKKYDHLKIEKKQQKKWVKNKIYKTSETKGKKSCYVLDMFPYPSGDGLHVGHPKGYIATDIYSRFKKMSGFNVLHPMGWDAFGLPAENYAIKNKIHPEVAVKKNIKRFKKQLLVLGFNYDWEREFSTTDPEYYRWTQWIFLKMYKKGLAFESHEPINWCPNCKTGLANEDLEDGKCERCGSAVEQKPIRQWMLKITDYADRMLQDLSLLPKWPESIKESQRNWIGRKEGVIISHKVEGSSIFLNTFSAYPAWLFADTFIVMAPEHPLVLDLIKGKKNEKEILDFIEEVKNKPEIERGAMNKEKKGFFLDAYALDPINKTKMPIWIANFAMMNFGTGIIRCSAHDTRDFEFAQKYNIPLKEVVERTSDKPINAHDNRGVLKNSGVFSGKEINENLIKEMVNYFVKEGYGKKETIYKLKDWVFSRQRYWGEPIPLIHCEKCGVVPVPEKNLPVKLPKVKNYEPTGTGESPLANIKKWVNVKCPRCKLNAKRETNTMPQWAGSCWYYLRFIDPKNKKVFIDPRKEKTFMPVSLYVGGAEHATRHLIYARFWHKFLYDQKLVSTKEPFEQLYSVGLISAEDGRKMSKRYGNVINPDDIVKIYGADTLRVYEMFMGPFTQGIAWSTKNIIGSRRFIERVWNMTKFTSKTESENITKELHKTIKKVSEDIENFSFNTAISSMMIFVNSVYESKSITKKTFEDFLKLLSPFAPHITDEIWQNFGNKKSIYLEKWPSFNPKLIQENKIKMMVMINGKVRGEVEAENNLKEEELIELVKKEEKVLAYLKGKNIKKTIVVKGKIISFVI